MSMLFEREHDAPPFQPIEYKDGFLPIKDHGLIGDGNTAALIGRDGVVVWMCVPRFDAPALFARLLDVSRGGAFVLAPDEIREARQYYLGDTAILITEIRTASGLVQLTDALTTRSGASLTEGLSVARGELLRRVQVLEGAVTMRMELKPRGGAEATARGDGLQIRCSSLNDLDLQLYANHPLEGPRATYQLKPGDPLDFILSWGPSSYNYRAEKPDQLLNGTCDAWQRWISSFQYDGPQKALVRRSAITLKLLDYFASGAIVAAPTTSLPEHIGGVRNWDYRYSWIRDAAFSVYALRRIGLDREAWAFLGWVLDDVERPERPCVLYTLDGGQPPPEREDDQLRGYRDSRPVRWGNAAADQVQRDVYGEMLDCAYQWTSRGGKISAHLWNQLRRFVERARDEWRTPDHGIWEVRTSGRPFTYSAALCHVALDRGARLAQRFGHEGDITGWRNEAANIQEAILEEAWDPKQNALTEQLEGSGGLDASLLSLPLRRVLPVDHPKMVATTEAIANRLGAGHGLIYRYDPEKSPDGLQGDEGAFLLCSFWLVDNWAKQGRLDNAMELYDSLCSRAGPLGLLPEEIDPQNGEFLGNYPQAFSHVGVISSGVNLARLLQKQGR
jgi:alpha,alpha-trehalase